MGQDSTETEQPVDSPTPQILSALPTEPFRVVHSLSFGMGEDQQLYQLLIEAPTLKAARGISQVAFASFWSIVSQEILNGGSQ